MVPISAIGLASAVIGIFKETYLVGDWIYKIIRSGIKQNEEREEIAERFYTELLKLASFGHFFRKSQGNIANDSELDKRIYKVFAELSHDFGEYAALIWKEDDSKFKRDERSHELAKSLQLIKEPTKTTHKGWMPSFHFQSKRLAESDLVIGAKWALFRADKLRRIKTKFQTRNEELENILPLAIASWIQQNDSNSQYGAAIIDNLATDKDAQILGLSKHAKIRGLIKDQMSSKHPELHLRNTRIISTEEKSTIHVGKIGTVIAHGNSEHQGVLIEYKSYGPSSEMKYYQMISDASHPSPKIPPTVSQLGSLLYFSGGNVMGNLPFKGYLDQPSNGHVAFIFHFPRNILEIPGRIYGSHDLR